MLGAHYSSGSIGRVFRVTFLSIFLEGKRERALGTSLCDQPYLPGPIRADRPDIDSSHGRINPPSVRPYAEELRDHTS